MWECGLDSSASRKDPVTEWTFRLHIRWQAKSAAGLVKTGVSSLLLASENVHTTLHTPQCYHIHRIQATTLQMKQAHTKYLHLYKVYSVYKICLINLFHWFLVFNTAHYRGLHPNKISGSHDGNYTEYCLLRSDTGIFEKHAPVCQQISTIQHGVTPWKTGTFTGCQTFFSKNPASLLQLRQCEAMPYWLRRESGLPASSTTKHYKTEANNVHSLVHNSTGHTFPELQVQVTDVSVLN